MLAKLDKLRATFQIGTEPRWWCVSHAKLGLETLEQDIVINCVESGRQIETDEDSDLLVIGRSVHSVEDLQQRCFRQVSLLVRD